MKGAFQIARIFDIPVKIHWSFILIFVWIGSIAYQNSDKFDTDQFIWLSIGVIALFTCVLMHEFGHALTARRFGIGTRDIVLLPIGGVAMLNKLPNKPFQEFLVALAGPLVNLGISIVSMLYFLFLSDEKQSDIYQWIVHIGNPDGNFYIENINSVDQFFIGLVLLNLGVAVFNLLPAFPMDGGRIFRALLSMRMKRINATRIATYLGQFLAVVLLIFSVIQFNFLAAFVSVFVFVTAMNEYRAIKQEYILDHFSVQQIFRPEFTAIYETDGLDFALSKSEEGEEKQFLVFDQWRNIKGSLGPEELKPVKKKNLSTSVGQIMQKGYDALLPEDPLKEAFYQLYNNKRGIMPVMAKGKLVGVLDEETLFQFLDHQIRKMR
jgi:Zn-dependent protease